jgi:hypothetical protein
LPAKVRHAERRYPPRAGRAWSTSGPHAIGTERFTTVPSGASFAQVAEAIRPHRRPESPRPPVASAARGAARLGTAPAPAGPAPRPEWPVVAVGLSVDGPGAGSWLAGVAFAVQFDHHVGAQGGVLLLHAALLGRPTAPGMTPRSGRFRVRPVRQDQPHHQGPPPSSLAVHCSAGRRRCFWMASWPWPSPRPCATGCCTWPPASSATPAA